MTTAQATNGTTAQAPATTTADNGMTPDSASSAEPSDTLSTEDNALLASLVAAMREVADRERDASLRGLREAVETAIAAQRSRAEDGSANLRRRADEEITGIQEWVTHEIERVTAEGDRKIEARRQQLEQQLTDNEERNQHEIERLKGRVDEYERTLTAFFAQLSQIDDPAAFGAAAKRMPRPPALGPTPTTTEAPTGGETPAATAAAAPVEGKTNAIVAVTETSAGSSKKAKETSDANGADSEMVEEHRTRLDAMGLGGNGAAQGTEDGTDAAGGSATAPDPAADDPLTTRLAELDASLAEGESGAEQTADAATASATAAPASEVATAIVVHGLGSFGAITSFKQALERVDGVRGISLSLGPTGEFVYRATHDAGFDLEAAIAEIERGSAQIERQPDGSLRVTVQRSR